MDLKDCVTFSKYEKFPPTYVLRYHGINPVVSLLLEILRIKPITLNQFHEYHIFAAGVYCRPGNPSKWAAEF